MKKIIKIIKIIFLVLTISVIISCDTGLGLIETKISGNVIFLNSDRKPDKVESVWVIAAAKSLFENPSLNDLIMSDRPVNLSKDTSGYDIFVPVGTYTLVAAIWKEKNKDWDYMNLLGLYGFNPNTGVIEDADPIVISDEQKVASNRNIICDWGFLLAGKTTAVGKNVILQD